VTDTSWPEFDTLWVDATKALIHAFAAPGQTGPQRVAAILGVSEGTISRWQNDYKMRMPGAVAMKLEMIIGRPVFAQTFAALTGSRVVSTEVDPASDAGLVAGFFETTAQVGELTSVWADAARDGVHTPRERQQIREKLHQTIDVLSAKARLLSEGGPA
jgi:predicted transcriptional regulator